MQRLITLAVLAITLAVVSSVRAEDDAAKAQQFVDRGIKAAGGAKALNRLKIAAVEDKGLYYGMGEGVPYEGKFETSLPDKFRVEILNVFVIVVDGDKGWLRSPAGTIAMPAEQLAEQKKQQHTSFVATLIPLVKPSKKYKLSLFGETEVDGEQCDGVTVASDKQRSVTLLFSRKSGLLRKSEYIVHSDELDKEVVEESLYSDYRDVENLKVAHKLVINRDGKKFVVSETQKISLKKEAGPSWFAKPE
ncbi:MAG: hypothetical protein ACI8P0_004425 [Planctomycetaceae bacterium]|jgi:hypothetical protein